MNNIKVKSTSMDTNALTPKLLPLPKYKSVFHIDGIPILPPLMTSEKRKQMQKYKEIAMKLERKYLDKKQEQTMNCCAELLERLSMNPSQINSTSTYSDNNSFRLNYLDDNFKDLETLNSYLILSDIQEKQQEKYKQKQLIETKVMEMDNNSITEEKSIKSVDIGALERMKKLKQSETIIYDNFSNTIIMPMTDLDRKMQNLRKDKLSNKNDTKARPIDSNANDISNNSIAKGNDKLKNLYLEKSFNHVPLINIRPPTPQTNGNAGVLASGSDSNESVDLGINSIVENKKGFNTYVKEKKIERLTLRGNFNLNSIKLGLTSPKKSLSIDIPKKNIQHGIGRSPSITSNPTNLQDIRSSSISPRSVSKPSTINKNSENNLVRSNSFTLESPSHALLEHMRCANVLSRKVPSDSATRDTIESKAKRVQKVDSKCRNLQNRSVTKSNLSHLNCHGSKHNHLNKSNTGICQKVKRSPYEGRMSIPKVKSIRVPKKSISSTTFTLKSPLSQNVGKVPNSSTIKIESLKTASLQTFEPKFGLNNKSINDFEAAKREKFLKLIAQQKEEQKRLQQTFEMQQKILLGQLVNETNISETKIDGLNSAENTTDYIDLVLENLSPKSSWDSSELPSEGSSNSSPEQHACSIDESNLTPCNENTISTPKSKTSSRRRLFTVDGSESSLSVRSTQTVKSTNSSNSLNKKSQIEYAAATIINAHARGFLVRRLFQTEQIQRIVQTIRDTLIFVINLHLETSNNPDEAATLANIRLKARLLQQLSSASRTLHLVFFQTTIKERMDIISRDRKRIKTNLVTKHLKRFITKKL